MALLVNIFVFLEEFCEFDVILEESAARALMRHKRTGWYWPPSYSVGVRSPCVFSLLEAHAMGPPCVGPPQLGVVADGNATLGRLITPSLPYWEGDDHQPLSA